jgi:hypothetical protein
MDWKCRFCCARDIASDHVFLYELDCVYTDHSIELACWDMTKANPNSYTVLRKSHTILRKLLGGEGMAAA